MLTNEKVRKPGSQNVILYLKTFRVEEFDKRGPKKQTDDGWRLMAAAPDDKYAHYQLVCRLLPQCVLFNYLWHVSSVFILFCSIVRNYCKVSYLSHLINRKRTSLIFCKEINRFMIHQQLKYLYSVDVAARFSSECDMKSQHLLFLQ